MRREPGELGGARNRNLKLETGNSFEIDWSLGVEVRHAKGEVREAIMQFAARRGLRASTPWWLEGVRIENPGRAPVPKPERIAEMGVFAAIVAFLTPPS